MLAVDTNVLVRLVASDEADQVSAAEDFVSKGAQELPALSCRNTPISSFAARGLIVSEITQDYAEVLWEDTQLGTVHRRASLEPAPIP
jgi:hypothetical protein